MPAFSDDIMKFRINVQLKADAAFRKIVLDLDRKIVQGTGGLPGTPVDTGRARGNWQSNIGPQPVAVATDKTDKDGASTIADIQNNTLNNLKAGDTVWLSNALPYIEVLEYGLYPNPPKKGTGKTESGFSTQAVGGFVAVACAEFGDMLSEVA